MTTKKISPTHPTLNFNTIEKKHQEKWEKKKIFQVSEKSEKPKYYVLEQFPYPSGSGLHMGHAFIYTIGDIFARFKIMSGFNVLHPMGYDSFGLPAENAAIKAGTHPSKYTNGAIQNFIKQQKALGLSYDWTRMFWAHDPGYYKWDQWIFLKMFEKGLAYQKESEVNWCPKCNTVLANEQVTNGKCWRHEDTNVEVKTLKQWFLKITDYADELSDFKSIEDWPEMIKVLQKNWINRKEWIDIDYEIDGADKQITVSTTRPDTNFGATFIVIAPEHPLLSKEEGLVSEDRREEVDKYIQEAKNKTEEERVEEGTKKTGVFTGLYAVNQLTKKKMPIWVTDFVLMSVGTGIVVGVPGHDIRDFEFAKEYNIPIVRVVVGSDGDTSEITKKEQVQEEEGTMINSGFLDGMDIHAATKKIMDYIEKKGWGRRTFRYRLKDWGISRQRYWGTPIPVVHCGKCGSVPVNEKDLPIELPEKVKFGKGNPLETAEKWIKVKCPKCRGEGKRETDTMDTFVNSSWYYLRYCDNKNDKNIFNPRKANYWCPIDMYIGGKEHACMHDIYFRFYHKFLRDLSLVKSDEPAHKLFVQGMIHGEDGNKMSKSVGNVIDPLNIIKKYGADSLRMFLVSVASPDSDFNWSDKGIQGINKFVIRFFNGIGGLKVGKSSKRLESKLNKSIKEITEYIENFKYNLAVIKLRSLLDVFIEEGGASKEDTESYLKLMSVFCPHICEELWSKVGGRGFISLADWPKCDEKKIDAKLEKQEEQVDKTVSDINNILGIIRDKEGREASKIYLYVVPNEVGVYDSERLSSRVGKEVKVFAVNDKKKYDPQGKSSKVKPGRPGVFVE